jgi:predicted phosphoribosyltransferase
VVGAALAEVLGAGLAALPVRRFGTPDGASLIIGVATPDGHVLVDRDLAGRLGLSDADLTEQADQAGAVVEAAMKVLGIVEPEVGGREAVLVDEGAASGLHVRAALAYLRRRGAGRLACALPVAPPATVDRVAADADEIVCLLQPLRLGSVGDWYEHFPPVTEDEVRRLLGRA